MTACGCEHIDAGTFADPDATVVARWCAAHEPPIVAARREVDDLDRATGLHRGPGWRPLRTEART